jgi:hypothetical protein
MNVIILYFHQKLVLVIERCVKQVFPEPRLVDINWKGLDDDTSHVDPFVNLYKNYIYDSSLSRVFIDWLHQFEKNFELFILNNFTFLKDYFIINDLLWQDGFLIDFLQKKIADKWIRNFVIYSGYLFNERFLFDYVVRFYIDSIIWKFYRKSIFEFNNVASLLLITLTTLICMFLIISLIFLF